MKARIINILFIFVLVLSFSTSGLAQSGITVLPGAVTPDSIYSADNLKTESAAPSTERQAAVASGLKLVSVIVTFDPSVDAQDLEAITGGTVIHRFSKLFNGASLVLPESQVAGLADIAGVTNVYLDELRQPDTENSPGFVGAPTVWNALGGQESAGEGVVVGVLDTGIWPEHPSFSDPDPSGKPYAPPAVMPGSNGFGASGARNTCNFGNSAYNPNDAPFTCNNKLIGAYEFLDTYKAVNGLLLDEFDSARDDNGHGTHTSSTSAGNAGVAASIFGVPRGTISGIAPRAHVIMYRVCADIGCFSSDSAAAVEQAILDGVDAINFSISGGSNPFSDVVSLAFLSAYNNGVFVAASAGNSGPGADTTAHREPWVTTVAASTQNRAFETTVTLAGTGGASLSLTGTSLTDGIGSAEVVVAPDPLCQGPYTPGQFSGKVVVCRRGTSGRAEKGFTVLQGNAAGMILYNQNTNVTDLETDNHWLPAVHIQFNQGQDLLAFLAANPGATATWSAGVAVASQGDVMASFSSRGGVNQTLGVSKPDVTAPGVQILAGHTAYSVDVATGPNGQLFQAIAGTSMSSPHVAGAGALLKALHPDWTPGQIKSALMTTAFGGVVKEDGVTPATPFDDGSGRINLNNAGSPGLTFDETGANYVALQNQLWNANYPSLYVPRMPGKITVSRTVHSVLSKPSTWTITVDSPADVKVITPRRFVSVLAGRDATFSFTVDANRVPVGEVRHATLYLTSNYGTLHFPITIVRRQPPVTVTKSCAPADLLFRQTTTCTATILNSGFDTASVSFADRIPMGLLPIPSSVTGATLTGRTVAFSGALAGATPPDVMVGPGASPAGYLPLSLFGITPIVGMGDETIANFNVPAFSFAGQTYTRVGVVSNGYAIIGGGTGGDVQFVNQSMPDPAPPNNVLAPFWSDLNPAFGGAVRIGVLTDGVTSWLIIDWEGVVNYSNRLPNSFQIWIQLGSVQDVTFTYGTVSTGDLGLLTVGAENRFGNRGQNAYYNGAGLAPAAGVDVAVTTTPPIPAEPHVITYMVQGIKTGTWTNCAELTSDMFQGVNVACFDVRVTR